MKKTLLPLLAMFYLSGCSYVFDANNTDLIKAVFENNITKIKEIASTTADIDDTNSYGLTALMYASRAGDKEIVKTLLKYGADVNMYSKGTDFFLTFITEEPITTALQEALGKSQGSATFNQNHINTAKVLIEHNAYIDKEAIYHLGTTGDITLLELMISKKNRAISNNADFYSKALYGAITYEKFNMIKYLLEHGANPNMKLEDGGSILLVSIKLKSKRKEWDNKYKIIKLLLKYGADKTFKAKYEDKNIIEMVRANAQKEGREVAEYFYTILKILTRDEAPASSRSLE